MYTVSIIIFLNKKDKGHEYTRENIGSFLKEKEIKGGGYAREKYRKISEDEKDKKRKCLYTLERYLSKCNLTKKL